MRELNEIVQEYVREVTDAPGFDWNQFNGTIKIPKQIYDTCRQRRSAMLAYDGIYWGADIRGTVHLILLKPAEETE